jgi:hypothetical protein
MPPVYVPITLVRWPRRDAAEQLDAFVFGSKFAGFRPPRGFDPEFVSYWIREFVKPDAGPVALMRIGHLLRFYERADVLDHLSRFLSRTDATARGFNCNAYILQCIGEAGTPEQKRFAAGLFGELLIPHPLAMPMFPLLLETAVVLAGYVDYGAIGRLMQRELDTASKAADLRGPEGLPWRKYSDYNRNQLPEAIAAIETKQRLLTTDPAQRLQELLFVYLGESPVSSPPIEIWAGRLLRQFAIDDGQPAVVAAFAKIIDGALNSKMPQPKKDFLVHRSAQAILYLQGELSFPQEAAFETIKSGPENFLWDDPGAPSHPI